VTCLPHVSSVFNGLAAARLASVRSSPCRIVTWKIYTHTRPDGAHDGRVVRGYLFICLQHVEPVLGTHGHSGATLSQKVGARAQVTCGGPGAAPGREAGARAVGARCGLGAAPSWEPEPWGHVTTPELPPAGRREPLS
jgi:hypothetical protein